MHFFDTSIQLLKVARWICYVLLTNTVFLLRREYGSPHLVSPLPLVPCLPRYGEFTWFSPMQNSEKRLVRDLYISWLRETVRVKTLHTVVFNTKPSEVPLQSTATCDRVAKAIVLQLGNPEFEFSTTLVNTLASRFASDQPSGIFMTFLSFFK